MIRSNKLIVSIPIKTSWDCHILTDLEILQNELDQGSRVLVCIPHWENVKYDTVDAIMKNKKKEKKERKRYVKKLLLAYGFLKGNVEILKIKNVNVSDDFSNWLEDNLNKRSLVTEVMDMKYEGFDIGASVVSSFMSMTRDLSAMINENKELVKGLFENSFSVYEMTKIIIQNNAPDVIQIFNGRFATSRGVFFLSKKQNIECHIHERGHDKDHYEIYINNLPHNISYFKEKLRTTTKKLSAEELIYYSSKFFKSLRYGKELGWISFVKNQNEGVLPSEWDEVKKNIVIFNSSEDEFVSISDEWKNPIYNDQISGVEKILTDLKNPNIDFWVRMHPNLKDVPEFEREKWYALKRKYKNVHIISPDDNMSTYTLMDKASVVLTFGSSVGIESAFWNKPSILAGISFYRGLGSTYDAQNHDEVISYLKSDLTALDSAGAIMYGAYLASYGIRYKYVTMEDLFNGSFKGRNLKNEMRKFKTRIFG